jgi:hypothetical protein
MAKFQIEVIGEWADAVEAVDIELAVSKHLENMFVAAKVID